MEDAVAARSTSLRNGPSPAITRRSRGTDATASTATCGPFSGTNAPRKSATELSSSRPKRCRAAASLRGRIEELERQALESSSRLAEAERTVEELGDKKGVIGFCVTSTRHKPVHHNDYMRLYSMIEATGKPLAFHAGYHWQDPSLATVNRFLGMHALGFVWCNMVHMTNWILNGIPERFPKLKALWVESGLAWVPFLMQRLDDQYLMRPSEAPQLKRMPSEYMNHNCFYTTQPMEDGKVKLVLLAESGKTEEFFIIPTKSGRDLLIHAAEKGARKIWDGTHAVDV